MTRYLIRPILAGGALAILAFSACAQADDAFFKSHKLILASSSNAGGGLDTYARLLSRHISRHIPGNPTTIVQNVPAAGGIALANVVYNTAPKDGTYIGMVRGTVIQEQIYKNPQVQFDGRKFAWIGNMNSDYDACVMWATSGVRSVADFYTREIVVGASGAGAQSYSLPIVYNELLGTKFKVISGYAGTPERALAMERGELTGACGINTSTFRSILSQPYREGKLLLVAQAGETKDPAYPDVPNMLDQAQSPDVREALAFLFAPLSLGRSFAAAPETPNDRVTLLRQAFNAAMKDPALIADAQKQQIDLELMDGETNAKMVAQLYATPAPVISKLRAALAH